MYIILNKTNAGITLDKVSLKSNDSVTLTEAEFNALDQTVIAAALSASQIEVDNLNPPTQPSITLDFIKSLLGNAQGYITSAVGAVLRTFSDKLNDTNPSIKDFYQSTDGNDYGPALSRALATGLPVFWPAGNYVVANPVAMVDGMTVKGAGRCRALKGATYIEAPKGMFFNPTAKRKSIYVENLHINGTSVGRTTAYGFQGAFGGDIIGCKLESYIDVVQNPSAYLSRYISNYISSCTNGLNLADTNGTVIALNHFEANVATSVTNVDVTPTSGTNNGTPLIIRENNFNLFSSMTVQRSALKLRGMILGYGNYFEDFAPTAGTMGSIMVDVTVNQWDKMGFTWFANQMNGQGKSMYGLRFTGSTLNPCSAAGAVFGNRIAGFTGSAINFGTNNNIVDLRIMDNNYGNSDVAITGGPLVAYKPVISTTFASKVNTDPTKATVDQPIVYAVVIDNSSAVRTDNTIHIPATGMYRVTVTAKLDPSANLYLYNGGTVIATAVNGTILTTLQFNRANVLTLKVVGAGKPATNGTLTLESIGDGNA